MERETGFEPATPSLEGSRSSQLSYSRLYHEFRSSDSLPPDVACEGRHPALRPVRKLFATKTEAGGERRIRTSEGMSQQIYSLPPLAAWVSPPQALHKTLAWSALTVSASAGAGGGNRTPDRLITNQLLYLLSYASRQTINLSNQLLQFKRLIEGIFP